MYKDFDDGTKQLKCSFCSKTQDQVKRLIAGPGVYICDECVELCKEIIEEEPDIHVLRKKYKLNLDVFMVGMTLLHAVFRYNLDYTKYRHLIDRLTSITHPWRSAKEALHHVKELIQK